MSERGIEIHNGEVVFPEGMPQELHLGTLASPLTQGEAGQTVLSAVINAIALGGTVVAGLFGVIGSVDLTGDLKGLRAKAVVNDGITVTGSVFGAYIETEVLGAGEITTNFEGIRIEKYVESGVDISASTVYGLHIANSIASEPSSYSFIRMSENQASTVRSVFLIAKGVLCTDIEYLFEISGAGSYFEGVDSSHTTSRGWFKVLVPGAEDRYIQLFT